MEHDDLMTTLRLACHKIVDNADKYLLLKIISMNPDSSKLHLQTHIQRLSSFSLPFQTSSPFPNEQLLLTKNPKMLLKKVNNNHNKTNHLMMGYQFLPYGRGWGLEKQIIYPVVFRLQS